MNTQQRTDQLTSVVWNRAVHGIVRVSMNLVARTSPQQVARRHDPPQQAPLDRALVARAEALFVQALCDDSNLEADWLWLATQVLREHEQRYCLQRALQIDPNSERARRALAMLPPLPPHVQRMTSYSH